MHKKMIAFIFALVMILCCIPAFADDSLTEIDTVDIGNVYTDLDLHEIPEFTTTVSPDTATIEEQKWYGVDELVPGGTAKPTPAATYNFSVSLQAEDGYCFSKPLTVKYEGKTVAPEKLTVYYRNTEKTRVLIRGIVDPVYIPYEVPYTSIQNVVNETKEYVNVYYIDGAEKTEAEYLDYRQSHAYSEKISMDFVKELSRTLVNSTTELTGKELKKDSEGQDYWLCYYTRTDEYDVVSQYKRTYTLTTGSAPTQPKRIDFVAVTNVDKLLKKDETPAFTAEISDVTYSSGAALRDRISVSGERWIGPNTLVKGSNAKAQVGTYEYEVTIKAADKFFFDGKPFQFYIDGESVEYSDLDVSYPDQSTAVIKGFISPVTVKDTSGPDVPGPDDPPGPDIQTQTVTTVERHDNTTKQYVNSYYINGKSVGEVEYLATKQTQAYSEKVKTTYDKELSRVQTSTSTVFTGTEQQGDVTIYYYTRHEYYDVTEQYQRRYDLTVDESSDQGTPDGQSQQGNQDDTVVPVYELSPNTSAKAADKLITTSDNEEIAGATFSKLRAKQSKVTKKSVKIKWSPASGAVKYIVYGNRCGRANKYKKLAEVTGLSYTQKGLKKGKYNKYLIIAVNGQGKVIAASKTLHIATKGGKYGNVSKVTAKKPKTLKAGKKFKLKAKQIGSKVKKHRKICYESTNPSVATVSSSGTVKAKGKGTCYVYAYAQNGMYKKIKIKVK